jgi:taurine dioxygenase
MHDGSIGSALVLAFTPLGSFGAEVSGTSLQRPIDAETAGRLRMALDEFQFLMFRDQRLSPAEQGRLTHCFGDPEPGLARRPEGHQVPGHPEILYLSNKPGSVTVDYGMGFHSDGLAYARVPHGITMLHCIASPPHAGDTLFADQYRAYEFLPADVRAVAHDLYWYLPPIPFSEVPAGKNLAQPIARVHPRTRRPFVFCAPNAVQLHGLTSAESARILDVVHACQVREECVYRHAWRPGDTVVWENRTLLHSRAGAVDFATQGERVMHRSATSGDFAARQYEKL